MGAAGKEALERFEATAEIATEREQFARRAALVVAVMAALLALSTLAANNQMERSIISQELATAKLLQASWETSAAEREKLQSEAKKLEATRHDAEAKHRLYQFAEAAFQLGIVLASVAILTRQFWMLVVSGGAGVVGLLFFVDGWLLIVAEPLVHVIE